MAYQKYNISNNAIGELALPIDNQAMIFKMTANYDRFPASNFIIKMTEYSGDDVAVRENMLISNRYGDSFVVAERAYEPVPVDDSASSAIQQAQNFSANSVIELVISAEMYKDLQEGIDEKVGLDGDETIDGVKEFLKTPLIPDYDTDHTKPDYEEQAVNVKRLNEMGASLGAVPRLTEQIFPLGENVSKNDFLYLKQSDGKLYKTDASDPDKLPSDGLIRIAQTAGSANETIPVTYYGEHGGFSGFGVGDIYYLSDIAGKISGSSGTNLVKVGKAISETTLILNTKKAIVSGEDIEINFNKTGASMVSEGEKYQFSFENNGMSGIYRIVVNVGGDLSIQQKIIIKKGGIVVGEIEHNRQTGGEVSVDMYLGLGQYDVFTRIVSGYGGSRSTYFHSFKVRYSILEETLPNNTPLFYY